MKVFREKASIEIGSLSSWGSRSCVVGTKPTEASILSRPLVAIMCYMLTKTFASHPLQYFLSSQILILVG